MHKDGYLILAMLLTASQALTDARTPMRPSKCRRSFRLRQNRSDAPVPVKHQYIHLPCWYPVN